MISGRALLLSAPAVALVLMPAAPAWPAGIPFTAQQAGAAHGRPQPDHTEIKVVASAVYGLRDGKPFFRLLAGRLAAGYRPDPGVLRHSDLLRPGQSPAALASGSCHEYVSEISHPGGAAPLLWRTQQACSGSFGRQWVTTQVFRSSWRGYVAYSGVYQSNRRAAGTVTVYWRARCHSGHGRYDYLASMAGHSTRLGDGPPLYSAQPVSANCGAHS